MPYMLFLVCFVSGQLYAGESSEDTGFFYGITSTYFYDDNLSRDNQLTLDAYALVLRPYIGAGWRTKKGTFNLQLVNETAKYEQSSDDNYSDSELSFSANYLFTSRHALDFDAALTQGHDDRGTVFATGNGASQTQVDTYSSNSSDISYTYGRNDAAGQLIFNYSWDKIDYDARLDNDGTDRTLIRDRRDQGFDLIFEYQLTAKTDLIANYSEIDRKYDVETSFGSQSSALLFGLSWEATAKTSGRVLFGEQTTESTTGNQSFDNTVWEAEVEWSPRTYSTLILTSGRSASPSFGIGNSTDLSTTSVEWIHEWTSRISTSATITKQSEDFLGTDIGLDTDIYTVGVNYSLTDNISLECSYESYDRQSNNNLEQFVYDRSITSLVVTIAY